MHVISRKRLVEFGWQHPDAVSPLDHWYRIVKAARFSSPVSLKEVFAAASVLDDRIVIFNVGGNKYRLVASVQYATETSAGRVFIRHVFTHPEYDAWSAAWRRARFRVLEVSMSRITTSTRLSSAVRRPLRTESEYDAAVAELDELLDHDPRPGTPEHDRLDLLAVLVAAYDDDHYPMGGTCTPQSVVDFLLDQHGETRADLVPVFGSRSRISEFFSGKRRLSIGQVQALRAKYGVSAEVLLEPVPPACSPVRDRE